jgi:hypothetical protein
MATEGRAVRGEFDQHRADDVMEHPLDARLLADVVRERDAAGGHDLLGAIILHRRDRFQLHLRVREDAPALAGVGREARQRRDRRGERVHLAAELDFIADADAVVDDELVDQRVEADLRRARVVILEQRLRVGEAADHDLAVFEIVRVDLEAVQKPLVDLRGVLRRCEDEVARQAINRLEGERALRPVRREDELRLRRFLGQSLERAFGRPLDLHADGGLGNA